MKLDKKTIVMIVAVTVIAALAIVAILKMNNLHKKEANNTEVSDTPVDSEKPVESVEPEKTIKPQPTVLESAKPTGDESESVAPEENVKYENSFEMSFVSDSSTLLERNNTVTTLRNRLEQAGIFDFQIEDDTTQGRLTIYYKNKSDKEMVSLILLPGSLKFRDWSNNVIIDTSMFADATISKDDETNEDSTRTVVFKLKAGSDSMFENYSVEHPNEELTLSINGEEKVKLVLGGVIYDGVFTVGNLTDDKLFDAMCIYAKCGEILELKDLSQQED